MPESFQRPILWSLYYGLNRVGGDEVLNGAGDCAAPAEPLDRALRHCLNQLKAEAIDSAGQHVDYATLKASSTFATFRSLAVCLQTFDLQSLKSHEERMAFWLNLYNALILHAVIERDMPRSVNTERGIFDRAAYCVGGYRFSANDIEHGILRCNRSHPLVPGPVFAAGDPRRDFIVQRFDPRLHAALNCAARSCPPIRFYDPDRLDAQLDLAMRIFVNGGAVEIDQARLRVSLSRIFSWYATDFGGRWFGYRAADRLIRYILPYIESSDDRTWLEANATKLRVRFLPYDWSLNA
jgi:Protein of unknown function, DUF547